MRRILTWLALGVALACGGVATRFLISPVQASVGPGQLIQFMAEGATFPITWSVQEADGGTVNANGLYQAPCPGVASTYHVVATAAGKTATAAVSVAADTPISITVDPPNATLTPNSTQQFTATVTTHCGVYQGNATGAAILRGETTKLKRVR